MEQWDIYDKYRNLTGKKRFRGDKLQSGEYHLVVHICVFNTKGELLIQQRQSFKEGWPNMWDVSVGGSAVAGENNSQAAERELFEELGIKNDFTESLPNFTITFMEGFDDWFFITKDIEISDLKFQYEEVQNAKWATKEEILQMIDDKIFIPYYKNLIGFIFDSRNHLGAHE